MAMLGIGDYLCEACKWFDTDGDDGELRHSGHFALHEVIAWGAHGGMPLLEKLCEEWEEFE